MVRDVEHQRACERAERSRYRFRGAGSIQTLTAIPMVMPEILMGISLLIFFASAGLPLGFSTVVVGHVTFSFPFVLVAVQARLRGLDPAMEEAALDLGATPLRAFWFVIVPCLRPAIVAGGLMAFSLSWDELIVTFFTTSAALDTGSAFEGMGSAREVTFACLAEPDATMALPVALGLVDAQSRLARHTLDGGCIRFDLLDDVLKVESEATPARVVGSDHATGQQVAD